MTHLLTRLLAAGALGALGLHGAASAQNCDDQGGNAVAGAVIGGILGGVVGAQVGNDNKDDYGRRGYRGHRGYRGYGYGHRHRYRGDNSNDDEVLAGVLLGALAGGVVGAASSDCDTSRGYSNTRGGTIVVGPQGQYDPYGRGQVTRSGEYGWGEDSYPASDRGYREPVYDDRYGQEPYYGDTRQTSSTAACKTVYSETRMPDGRMVREPARVCQDERGNWYYADEEELYGGY